MIWKPWQTWQRWQSMWQPMWQPMWQIVRLCGVAFCLLGTYAVARPASESLFLQRYTSRGLPLAWLALMVVVSVMVLWYVRLAARVSVPRLLRRGLLVSGAILLVLVAALRAQVPGAAFVLYLWKDTYLVILLEIFWSFASLTTRTESARWTYGLYCFMGSLGGLCCNLLVGPIALRIGTLGALLLVLPLMVLCGVCSLGLRVAHPPGAPAPPPGSRGPRSALVSRLTQGQQTRLSMVGGEAYLGYLVALVALVQVVLTLLDFQFNGAMERAYPDLDARTALIGRVYATIDGGCMVLQLLTGPILRFGGVPVVLFGVPVVLLGVLSGQAALAPGQLWQLWWCVTAKVAGKTLDYSIFRAAKEMLYIPLSYADKTQGKALVDMLGYRVAKGGASLLLLGLTALSGSPGHSDHRIDHQSDQWIESVLMPLNLGLCLGWLGLTAWIVARYRRLTALLVVRPDG